jgi:hypothetical protein
VGEAVVILRRRLPLLLFSLLVSVLVAPATARRDDALRRLNPEGLERNDRLDRAHGGVIGR